ncbi:hypothetical protein Ahu01nite_009940 [Winogradskya humida]|uniref:Uncharacterized protein n=1 Tax=Winogradskya humida TaxID=113566 RepID=A0ABQ3ZH77_9ACTN|nr:hypothetical protein Ahu01nite_009940 [Actinoplanes humidus]
MPSWARAIAAISRAGASGLGAGASVGTVRTAAAGFSVVMAHLDVTWTGRLPPATSSLEVIDRIDAKPSPNDGWVSFELAMRFVSGPTFVSFWAFCAFHAGRVKSGYVNNPRRTVEP